MKRLALVTLCCLLLVGCGGKENMEIEASQTPPATEAATAEPTATPTPTETPTMAPTAEPTATPEATAEPTDEPTATPLFVPRDENGNLIINPDLSESFTETTFPLPSAPVVLDRKSVV